MPEISFYLLPTSSGQDRDLFVCKLIEKAYRHGEYPYVLTGSPEHSQKIDDLLWTFRPGSFIPHQTYTGELPEFNREILIGAAQPQNPDKTSLLISHRNVRLLSLRRNAFWRLLRTMKKPKLQAEIVTVTINRPGLKS